MCVALGCGVSVGRAVAVREGVAVVSGVRVRVVLGCGVRVVDGVAVGRFSGGRPVESKVGRPNGVSWVGVGVSGSCAKPL